MDFDELDELIGRLESGADPWVESMREKAAWEERIAHPLAPLFSDDRPPSGREDILKLRASLLEKLKRKRRPQ
jgi:hypothetical protein